MAGFFLDGETAHGDDHAGGVFIIGRDIDRVQLAFEFSKIMRVFAERIFVAGDVFLVLAHGPLQRYRVQPDFARQ